MMSVVLFDSPQRNLLFPFTKTRAVAEIRAGIFTGKERWEMLTGESVQIWTVPYLQAKYSLLPADRYLLINSGFIANEDLAARVFNLKEDEAIAKDGELVAGVLSGDKTLSPQSFHPGEYKAVFDYEAPLVKILFPWHIFQLNGELIRKDFQIIQSKKKKRSIPASSDWKSPQNIFIEEGANTGHCYIDATEGPVYIAKDSVIMDGCMIQGPFAIMEGSVLKMGAKVYGATTIGPCCLVGGEIKNTVFSGYSNKAHDGYLGDSVVGEWCNLGAGTSNSNLRNDAGTIYASMANGENLPIGLKCGLFLGDYSRSAINTSFNTGTFAGVSSNIFGVGLTPKQIPDFTWGYTERYRLDKALEHIENWKKLRNQHISKAEIQILEHLYNQIER